MSEILDWPNGYNFGDVTWDDGIPRLSLVVGLSGMLLSATTVTSTKSLSGTVTLSGLAPDGGAVVNLSSSNSSVAQVPTSVVVLAGQMVASFSVTTSPVVVGTIVSISASCSDSKMSEDLTILPSLLPTNLPSGMLLWLANNTGVLSSGGAASVWKDQSGNSSDAVQTTLANQPMVVYGNNGQHALRFNGTSSFMGVSSIPINGLAGITVFIVSASRGDPKPSVGSHAFLYWHEVANWGDTFFGSFQTTSNFRFGTGQVGNENLIKLPFTRTYSFGLSEWMHAGTVDYMWFNGQLIASCTGKLLTTAGLPNNAFLGLGSGNSFYSGDTSEIIVYGRALSVLERQQVEQYLMGKYHL